MKKFKYDNPCLSFISVLVYLGLFIYSMIVFSNNVLPNIGKPDNEEHYQKLLNWFYALSIFLIVKECIGTISLCIDLGETATFLYHVAWRCLMMLAFIYFMAFTPITSTTNYCSSESRQQTTCDFFNQCVLPAYIMIVVIIAILFLLICFIPYQITHHKDEEKIDDTSEVLRNTLASMRELVETMEVDKKITEIKRARENGEPRNVQRDNDFIGYARVRNMRNMEKKYEEIMADRAKGKKREDVERDEKTIAIVLKDRSDALNIA